jgi:hypothetical protein
MLLSETYAPGAASSPPLSHPRAPRPASHRPQRTLLSSPVIHGPTQAIDLRARRRLLAPTLSPTLLPSLWPKESMNLTKVHSACLPL